MGCGGSQRQDSQQQLDPRMQQILYGVGNKPGMYQQAADLYLNRSPEQSVAGFNPLQQYAMQNMVNMINSGQLNGGANANNAVAQKLMAQGGVNWQAPPQQQSQTQIDISNLFRPQQSEQRQAPQQQQESKPVDQGYVQAFEQLMRQREYEQRQPFVFGSPDGGSG